MKKTTSLLSLVIASFLSEGLTAQQAKNVGINTETPNESAMLHIAPSLNFRHAIVEATISGGQVTGFNVIDGGQGYKEVPKVFVVSAASNIAKDGKRATGEVILENGKIASIKVTSPGSGYTTTPDVTIIPQDAHYGFVLPRVDLQDPLDKETPVKVSHDTDGADGLLVFNSGEPNNTTFTESRPYWFDNGPVIKKWNEGISALKTPKIAIFSLPEMKTDGLRGAGSSRPIIVNDSAHMEPITNVLGIHMYQNRLIFPRQKASYIIEVNLNLTAHGSSQGVPCVIGDGTCNEITDDGFMVFGYFVNLAPIRVAVDFNEDGTVKGTRGLGNNLSRERKEQAIIGKLEKEHNGIWQFAVDIPAVTPGEGENAHYGYAIDLGRMSNSSHQGDVTINSEGSFIKIYQIN